MHTTFLEWKGQLNFQKSRKHFIDQPISIIQIKMIRRDQEAKNKFIFIKQAFENIKIEKGLMKPHHLQNNDYDRSQTSMRPNPQQFYSDQSQHFRTANDYKIFSEKAAANAEYQRFNTSFKTIHDINDIKIKVEEGEMKDTLKRFNLEQYTKKITFFAESGKMYYTVIFFGFFMFTVLLVSMYDDKEIQAKEQALKMMTKIKQRKTIESEMEENKLENLQAMQNLPEIMEMQIRVRNESFKRDGEIKLIHDPVISLSKREKV